jgi:signal transduction histidine kinase
MNLKYKLALGSMLLTVVGILAISQFSYRLIKRTRQNELVSKGTILARKFGEQYARAIQNREESSLLKGLLDLLKDPEVLYGMVTDAQGRVIAHTNVHMVGGVLKGLAGRTPGAGDEVFTRRYNSSDQAILEVAVKTKAGDLPEEAFFLESAPDGRKSERPLGMVSVGLSMKPMLRFVASIGRGLIYIALAALASTFLFSMAFALLITHPISRLLAGIEAITKGDLASGVGHELRNPLGAIRNAIYYVRDSLKGDPIVQQDPSVMEFLDLADREIKSSTSIISDLLDFARVLKLELEDTDINVLIDSSLGAMEFPANVKLIKNLKEDLPHAPVDGQKMRQVFINLASNAVQAMPQGGELEIDTSLSGVSGNSADAVLIQFKDTGVGIRREDMKEIFEPLFTTKAKGTGLGLAICQGIVEKHGGMILVDSEVGKGSTFTVHLPCRTQI